MKKYLEAGLAVHGQHWYRREGRALKTFAWQEGINPNRFIDLIALFSPRIQLKRDLRNTLFYVRTGGFAHDVMRNVKIAVQHYEKTAEIRGLKCGAFARALKGDNEAVVLDTHMAGILGLDQKIFGTKSGYGYGVQRIMKYARRCGLAPAETQAALWCGKILLENRNPETVSYKLLLEAMP